MKNFKRLFLSATTVFLGLGTVDSADAFTPIGKFPKHSHSQNSEGNISGHNLDFLQTSARKNFSTQSQEEYSLEANQAQRTTLVNKILHHNQMGSAQHPSFIPPNSYIELIRALEAKVDSLTEEIRQSREAALKAPQALPIQENRDSENFREQINALSAQVRQLEESNLILSRSLVELQERRPEENSRFQLASLPSSAFQPLTSEGGFTATPRPSDDTATEPKSTLATTTFSTMPELEADAINSGILGVSEFERDVLGGKKPINLFPIDQDAWRTLTLLIYHGTQDDPSKVWSSWNGKYTTEELDKKFLYHPFMAKVFEVKKAMHSVIDDSSALTAESQITEYLTNSRPATMIIPFKPLDTELNEAYYYKGLYQALTGINLTHATADLPRAEFIIDPTTGLKEGVFRYNAQSKGGSNYQISIYDAERLYEGTPWYSLFISQAQMATEDALRKLKTSTEETYDAKQRKIVNSEEPDLETQALLAIQAEKSIEIEHITSRMTRVGQAESLRDIDEALQIS